MPDDSLIGQLSDKFIEEVRKGKLPDIEEYAQKYPELADRIRELFPALLILEGMAGPGDSERASPFAQSELSPGSMFGQYRIEREIGRGGMGIVYEAIHVLLEKRVALKILPIRPTMDAKHLERFFREARTAAGLHHTNIVPVFDVGQVAGTPYFAMQYIEGRSLDAILRTIQPDIKADIAVIASSDPTLDTNATTGNPSKQGVFSNRQENGTNRFFHDSSIRSKAGLPERLEDYFRWVAEIGIQVANGLAHAHERKVIHRDIKPSNLIIDDKDVVWIADFGLARRIEDPSVTQSGTLLGTPRYMSPEQAAVARQPVDQRSDIYSLGATLYELLTCRPVFEGNTPHDVISQIISREPTAPRRLSHLIPVDLSTIIMKAMAKRPEDRYQTAAQLADDLSRWLRMEPIKARRIGLVGRTTRWCRRNPRLAAVTATAAIIIIVLSGIYYAGLIEEYERTRLALERETEAKDQTLDALDQAESSKKQADTAREEAEAARILAENAQKLAERESENTRAALKREQEARASADLKGYVANLTNADLYMRSNAFSDMKLSLSECSPKLRGWEWGYLNLRANPALETIQLDSVPTQLALSSDGSKVLWLSEEKNEIQAADIRTRRLVPSPGSPTKQNSATGGPPYLIAFSRDGNRIARTLWKSNALTGPDPYLALRNGDIEQWNPLRDILEIAGDPNGTAISRSEFSRAGELWKQDASLFPYAYKMFGNVISAVFSPDGMSFAAWTWDDNVRICSADSGNILLSIPGGPNSVTAVAFSPDGDTVAVAYYQGFVHLWDVSSGKQISDFQGYNHPITWLSFRPDGKQIASCSSEGNVLLWDASSGKLVKTYSELKGSQLAFSAEGNRMVVRPGDNKIHVIKTDSGEEIISLSGHSASVSSAIFDSSGSQIISGSSDKTIRFWDANSFSYVKSLETPQGRLASALWNPDGRYIALNVSTWESSPKTIDPDTESVGIWDAQSGETVWIYHWPTEQSGWRHVFISPDASKAATVFNIYNKLTREYDSQIQLLNLSTGSKPNILIGRNGPINHIAFDPDGNTFATSEDDKTIILWDASSGKLLRTISGHKEWSAELLIFSPDSSRLLSASSDKTIRIWDVATGELSTIFRGHKDSITKALFNPDGNLVLSSSYGEKRVLAWDSLTGKERYSFSCSNSSIIFNKDGSRFYARCGDGTLSVRDAKTGRELDSCNMDADFYNSLALSPDGSRLIAGVGKTIKIYDVTSLMLLLTIPAHDNAVRSVAFSPDGNMILSVGYGKVNVWKSQRSN